ncbi:MAG: hypothetical protein ACREX9_14065 [Gammaproteobacteria bacterium]
MDISHFEFSVVVVANDHNPTILNPDFLGRQGVIQEGWGWKVVGPAITTPPFATVSYDSGVTVSIESHRLQVIDSSAPGSPQSSKAVNITQKYVEVLPHVRYSAVGINFRSIVEHADANAFLKARFLKSGVWDSEAHPLQTVGLKLVYPLDGGRVTLSLNGGTVTQPLEKEIKQLSGILIHANFHRDCHDYPGNAQVMAHLGNAEKDWAVYQSILSDLLNV